MCDDEWIKIAMADDSVVVELLLLLHQAPPPPPPPPAKRPPCLNLDWTVRRQRRSRSAPRHLGAEKKDETTRASPTTPLSWSCATSASCGGADGYEESSRPTKPTESSRSNKVANPSETTTTKRSRRKKTLVELKEEENLLLKERKNLKNELASLRLIVEKHRATNKGLKRMKLELESRKATEKAIFDQPQVGEAHYNPSNVALPTSITHKVHGDASPVCPANAASSKVPEIRKLEASFLLPDLNLPVEEDLSSNAIREIS